MDVCIQDESYNEHISSKSPKPLPSESLLPCGLCRGQNCFCLPFVFFFLKQLDIAPFLVGHFIVVKPPLGAFWCVFFSSLILTFRLPKPNLRTIRRAANFSFWMISLQKQLGPSCLKNIDLMTQWFVKFTNTYVNVRKSITLLACKVAIKKNEAIA